MSLFKKEKPDISKWIEAQKASPVMARPILPTTTEKSLNSASPQDIIGKAQKEIVALTDRIESLKSALADAQQDLEFWQTIAGNDNGKSISKTSVGTL